MAPLSRCVVCKLPIRTNEEVRCSICSETVHPGCTAADPSPSNSAVASQAPSTATICRLCSRSRHSGTDNNTLTISQSDTPLNISHFNAIMQQLNTLSKAVSTCNSNFEATNAQITALALEVVELKQENVSLSSKVNELEHVIAEFSIDVSFQEIRERCMRESNLIIFGLPMSNSKEQDILDVNTILSQILPSKNIKISGGDRFGRSLTNSRPFKAKLESSSVVLSILRKKRNISKELFPNVYIKQDLTQLQSKQLANLRVSLENRLINGEANLTIRYVGGVPKIVSTKEKPNKRAREEDASPKPDKGLKSNKVHI